jgi:hypothetical protein
MHVCGISRVSVRVYLDVRLMSLKMNLTLKEFY